MNIQPVHTPIDTTPVASVEAASTGRVTRADSNAGPAATWWISPPGQFFSVLHEVSQQYPIELQTALGGLVPRGGSAPASLTSAAASEPVLVATPRRTHATYGALAHGATLTTPPAALGHPMQVDSVVTTMHQLAVESPDEFHAMAIAVATSFASVAGAANGPEAATMSTLAMQLEQSAQMGAPVAPPVPHWQRAGPPLVPSVHPISGPAPRVDEQMPSDEAPSWMRTPTARPAAR
jgi:hypothetical protein